MALLAEPRLAEHAPPPAAPRILLAQAEPQLAAFIAHNLELEGLHLELATSRSAFENALYAARFDVIVIDEEVLRPVGLEGLAPALTKRAKVAEIIWLGESEGGVRGRVIPKPVILRDLLAAVRRAVPAHLHGAQPALVRVGDIVIEPHALRVRCAGRAIGLSVTEFRILSLLASDPGRVFSRQDILQDIWGPSAAIDPPTINQYIVRIRRAIGTSHACIRTVRRGGYALVGAEPVCDPISEVSVDADRRA